MLRIKKLSCENGMLFSATSISETISASTERVKRGPREIELKTFDRPHRANDRKTTWSFYSWQSISSRTEKDSTVLHIVAFDLNA